MQSTASRSSSDPNTVSDHELIDRTISGDHSSFAELIRRYQDRLYRSMLHEVGCSHIAEDIVQEAFVNAYRRLDTFAHQSQFYSWLYRIALNLRHTYHRKNARLSLLNDCNFRSDLQEDKGDSPSKSMQRQENRNAVRNALEKIEERHRRILILREFEEFDYNTIAKILGIELGTVRSRLHRARTRLREELKSQYGDDRRQQ